MNARALLDTLSAAGVRVMVSAAGDTLELSGKRPPAHLLDEVRACKPDLLEVLRPARPTPMPLVSSPDMDAAEVVAKCHNLSASSLSLTCEALPAHLADLVDTARWGRLPSGAVKLASGLVTDLESYVLAWAECWPRDRAHVLRRLEEAHAATVKP